jgi:lysophospholipase L1-like esterase
MKFRLPLLCLLSLLVPRWLAAEELPKVLIIGDSISGGYTPRVVKLLKGKAIVKHSPGNSQHTGTGLKRIDAWIGKTDWDVIHFNWGLWDLCYRHPKSKVQGRRDKVNGTLTTPLDVYERNLDTLVARLRKTDAVLIWAHTTVVPEGEAGRKMGDDQKYNDAAARVMKKHGVAVNDLLTLTKGFPPELFTKPGDVHYKAAGYDRIAQQVAAAIEAALQKQQ